ncbi:MAG: shikimate kinase, partial [Gemmataceae bacterium]|nr:shikimate kinase [Gemmataceae bacterium]
MSLLFLIGARGSGKTTAARLVAERLGRDWIDADAELERRAGRTVSELFAAEGEAAFRALESEVLADLCGRTRLVVATGGGVVLSPINRERMRSTGRVVWLRADPTALWARISADPTTAARRPALAGGGPEEVAQVLAAREALYQECAHA